jgi:hypothetical protein
LARRPLTDAEKIALFSERAAARIQPTDYRQAWHGWKRSETGSDDKQEYYFDTSGDRNNLVYGALYRNDVATYKLTDTDWYEAGDAVGDRTGGRLAC